MKDNLYILLTDRSLISISGEDARNFLQGLITNNINLLSPDNAVYALMLTPQGRFLYDLFLYEYEGKILLDCNSSRIEEIKKKLSMYKLRSKVTIENVSQELQVVAIMPSLTENIHSFSDPRSAKLPARAIMPKPLDDTSFKDNGLLEGTTDDYEYLRISLCIPSDNDMEYDKSFPLEYEMDTHNAIDYKKGCYVGQEVTARTHYRGTLRKKPYIVTAEPGINLAEYKGVEITSGEMKVGIMCSAVGNTGIALLRVEDLEKAEGIEVGGVGLNLGIS